MAFKEYFSSLYFRLIFLVILSVFPVLCLVVFNSIKDVQNDLLNRKVEALRLADLTAAGVTQIINTSHEMLTVIICTNAVRNLDIDACNERFSLIMKNSKYTYENIAMINENGDIVASGVDIGNRKLNVKSKMWWQNLQKVKDVHDVSLGCYELNLATQRPSFNIAHPFLNQKTGTILSGVFLCLNLSHFRDIISNQLLENGVIFIVDKNGVELARNPEGNLFAGQTCPFWEKHKNREFIEAVGLDGIVRLYTFLEVPNTDGNLYVGVGISKEHIVNESNKIFVLDMILLTTSVLIAIILAHFIANKYIVAGIKRLTKSSIDLKDGHWDVYTELNGGGPIELKKLIQTFNEMAKTLQKGHANLENTIKDRTKKLKEVNEDLARSNEELMKFAYVASHDLKAPLRAVNNLATWINEDTKQNKDVSHYLDMLNSRIKRMENLINGLLEYSRIGRIYVDKESVNVNEIIKEVSEELECAGITIDGELPIVEINRTRIKQIFSNLIGNSIKHHHNLSDLIVKISCISNDSHVFCVMDNGPGIEPEYHEKIFEIFQTLKTKDEVESTGIGLAIVKKIIEEENGKIWLESELGQGSKFFFSLPVNKYNMEYGENGKSL